ncbi:apolipoprotein(a)-like [Mercenaria mercenaria]|uniref:apolipoprotein(a)-like n=1 Tax=Mercenaria mercenaria TaxID=6596 RepID=UPI00234ED2C4|nr:apolipoprotein(a)-like [Mercenaria mercenaria]
MGCIHKSACSETHSPALVGKKRFIVDSTSLSTYCGKCCENDIGNCNRELCAKNGSLQPNTKVMELVNPPMQTGYCTDLYPQSCRILLIQNPNLCKETKFSHYACREYCGTCVNPGHHSLVPTTTGSTTTTTSSSSKYNTKDCYYNSRKYMGAQSITVSGKMCLNWVDVNPNMQGLPDTSVDKARNKCRDPKGYGRPWCFTSATTYDWEFCHIPVCQECFYQGNSWQYAGYVSVDKDNNTCLSWTNYTSQFGIHIDNFPDGSTVNAQNFCRDPFHSGTPMCFSGSKLNPCNVPVCPHTCRDDPEINCALLKQYVCRYEYTSVTMCPRTCNSCKFGLLPPLPQVSSSVCVDNPNANCQTLQSIICADPDGAQRFCPKTCNKCYV